MRMVVDFPEPFGPRNPVKIPGCTTKFRPSTASLVLYRLLRFSTSIMVGAFQAVVLFSNRAGDAHRSSALGAPWSAIGNRASADVMMVEGPELVVPDRGGRASAAALLAG